MAVKNVSISLVKVETVVAWMLFSETSSYLRSSQSSDKTRITSSYCPSPRLIETKL
jgi:hypothetical protein